ncbi:MAG TPA: hypothetical protein ENJ64_04315 [Thiotrichales bacterium]|nr:hypothetical protein [Thiotrichales bacterium]
MLKRIKAITVSIALLCSQAAVATNSGELALFGYQEFQKDNLVLFPQWLSVLERHIKDLAQSRDCTSSRLNRCSLSEWLAFLDTLRDLPADEQIRQVNRFANEHAYILDQENYGIADYWATPREFLHNDGDCEDYAIIKMLSLKWLGYDVNRMRVVVVQDTNLRTAHAVMSIEREDDVLILDNQISEVLSHTAIFHYVPVYSVNENRWWMHVPN